MLVLRGVSIHNKDQRQEGHFSYDLISSVNLHVHSLSWASVSHDWAVLDYPEGYQLWLLGYCRTNGTITEGGILDPIKAKEQLITRMCNLTSSPIRIKAGDLISRIVAVRVE